MNEDLPNQRLLADGTRGGVSPSLRSVDPFATHSAPMSGYTAFIAPVVFMSKMASNINTRLHKDPLPVHRKSASIKLAFFARPLLYKKTSSQRLFPFLCAKHLIQTFIPTRHLTLSPPVPAALTCLLSPAPASPSGLSPRLGPPWRQLWISGLTQSPSLMLA